MDLCMEMISCLIWQILTRIVWLDLSSTSWCQLSRGKRLTESSCGKLLKVCHSLPAPSIPSWSQKLVLRTCRLLVEVALGEKRSRTGLKGRFGRRSGRLFAMQSTVRITRASSRNAKVPSKRTMQPILSPSLRRTGSSSNTKRLSDKISMETDSGHKSATKGIRHADPFKKVTNLPKVMFF